MEEGCINNGHIEEAGGNDEIKLQVAVDVHCHIVETPSSLATIPQCETGKLFLMGTRTSDWDTVAKLAEEYPSRFHSFYGVHPWLADAHIDNAYEVAGQYEDVIGRLEQLLLKYPDASVGEIGLDAIAKDPITKQIYNQAHQYTLFTAQMALASKHARSVSIHSVQSHGKMLDYFRTLDKSGKNAPNVCPPAVMMHSFSGSVEICTALCKLKHIGRLFFFSYSHLVNSRSSKSLGVIRATPDDRVLVESDVNDVVHVDGAMQKAIAMVGAAKGWSFDKVLKQTTLNARAFLAMK
jgi:TatD DNase family protein